ncbi:hypothetical protein [Longimycelium tulufanense]|nr:hypothetical protein [Longimycelium tulufanense]
MWCQQLAEEAMPDQATGALAWPDDEPVGSLLAISRVDTATTETGLRRVEFWITAFSLPQTA